MRGVSLIDWQESRCDRSCGGGHHPSFNTEIFYFSLLICSELTNIGYRTSLRGEVDAIFVPEWNQDIETFNALVESAALDVHAYIVQCNDRSYGDSRIRAPSKDSWKRDILRVRGGRDDYCVTAEIDVQAFASFSVELFLAGWAIQAGARWVRDCT